jgi:hypothetical protein
LFIIIILKKEKKEKKEENIFYFSSNLDLTSLFAFRFNAGSLNNSLLTIFLSKAISTEYLFFLLKKRDDLNLKLKFYLKLKISTLLASSDYNCIHEQMA